MSHYSVNSGRDRCRRQGGFAIRRSSSCSVTLSSTTTVPWRSIAMKVSSQGIYMLSKSPRLFYIFEYVSGTVDLGNMWQYLWVKQLTVNSKIMNKYLWVTVPIPTWKTHFTGFCSVSAASTYFTLWTVMVCSQSTSVKQWLLYGGENGQWFSMVQVRSAYV